MSVLVPRERIEQTILLIRGHRVMLSTDLADLYAVEPRVLNQAVKRNRDRFPADFMFQVGAVSGEPIPMPSPSRVWQCCPACCEARGPFK
jgi:hypothetical protein